MSMKEYVNECQKQAICKLIAQQQLKRASLNKGEIYNERKQDFEFWYEVVNDHVMRDLLNKGCNCRYSLNVRDLLRDESYNLELTDDFAEEKFYIHTNGSIIGPMNIYQ